MNKALPQITQSVEDLRQKIKVEKDRQKNSRLQALFLVASGQARFRSQVARMLGFNRNSISAWFSAYEIGGIEEMLLIEKPKGRETLISEESQAEIKKILATQKGFRTYKEIHALVLETDNTEISYSAVHKFVRYRLQAKAKSARASHPKKTSPPSSSSKKSWRKI